MRRAGQILALGDSHKTEKYENVSSYLICFVTLNKRLFNHTNIIIRMRYKSKGGYDMLKLKVF